ncbi:hypothetical protein Egran_00014 [Elaphomyces granulatus]|uniref:Uncharacterized protein n=1 Tax=Elaphomyces granulatus TaxID=519963 RepID=A0A232M726_9EURO|nr:hypothetical protein Egran_00014 [Elaphomyces granulatus]
MPTQRGVSTSNPTPCANIDARAIAPTAEGISSRRVKPEIVVHNWGGPIYQKRCAEWDSRRWK